MVRGVHDTGDGDGKATVQRVWQSGFGYCSMIMPSTGPPPIPEFLSAEAHDFLILCFNRVPRDRPNATRLLRHPFAVAAPSSGSNSPLSRLVRETDSARSQVEPLKPRELNTDFSVHEGTATVEDAASSASNVVSVGEVVTRVQVEAQTRAGELDARHLRRAASSPPFRSWRPIEPRADGEDARKKQMVWEEELRRELEVQRAEMRRCVSRDRAVSAVCSVKKPRLPENPNCAPARNGAMREQTVRVSVTGDGLIGRASARGDASGTEKGSRGRSIAEIISTGRQLRITLGPAGDVALETSTPNPGSETALN